MKKVFSILITLGLICVLFEPLRPLIVLLVFLGIVTGFTKGVSRKKSRKTQIKNPDYSNPKFHRTEHEEDLSFSFSARHASVISEFEERLYDSAKKAANLNLHKEMTRQEIKAAIETLNNTIKTFNNFKSFCYRRTKKSNGTKNKKGAD
ncbi:MAG: hypothetical protein FWF85_05930 [Clostridiales bacterium]|nr:hypothetical protein [Clostridiales bacterium]